MPTIPGVAAADEAQAKAKSNRNLVAIVVCTVLFVGIGIAWWALRSSSAAPAQVTVAPESTPSPAPAELPPPPAGQGRVKNEIGSIEEFARPWTAKYFSYSHPMTREEVPAIAIRLPIGNGRTSTSYWVILAKAPYGQCNLEFVADVTEIARRFGFTATHPMVADPCTNTLYDPLKMGTLPNGSWSRGEIVQGAGFRPPMEIEVLIEGDRLSAGRAED